MFKVIIEDEVNLGIDNFLESYINIFLDRFSDTGIFNENTIRLNFISSVKEIRNNIFDKIKLEFSQENIFGYKEISENIYQFYISIEYLNIG